MDTKLEPIERLKIYTKCEMEAVLDVGGISAEQYKAVTQNYLLMKMLEQLEDIGKSLNLIAVQTRKVDE